MTPHKIILRQTDDWKSIEKHFKIFSAEKFITVSQLDKMAITITAVGIAKAKSLKNNFITDNFSLPGSN